MDFGITYTQEQERFRKEVRAWLEANVPAGKRLPVGERDYPPDMQPWWKEFRKELAAKGWLYPTFPTKYGGGGLSGDHEAILDEETERVGIPGPNPDKFSLNTLLVWGTEEQKQKFLVPQIIGEKGNQQKLTEPHSGADAANIKNRAVRDGDDWLLSGQNVFISAVGTEDYLPGPFITDPNAPRHRNMGYFWMPNFVAGVTVTEMDLLTGRQQKYVYMDNVRVPADHLIGGPTQGWQVLGTHLEFEHGGGGRAAPKDEMVEDLVGYVKTARRGSGTVGVDAVAAQDTAEAHLEAHVGRLMELRTHWMYSARMSIQYEGNLANVHGRHYSLRNAIRVRNVMGLYALLGHADPAAPNEGREERRQRNAAGQHHAGGSTNIAKVVLARRIGISRTKERAAPTPSTVGT